MSEHKEEILKSASLITTLTLISRVLGYLREQRTVLLLGATAVGDAYTLAYRIPNLLRRLVAEGSMNVSFVPVFAKYLRDGDQEEIWDFANRMFWTLSVLLASFAVLGVIFSPLIIRSMVWSGNERLPIELAVNLNRIMFPYIFCIGIAALSMGILNSYRVFGISAFAPVLLNLTIIAMSFLAGRFSNPGYALALGVLIGGVLQLAVQLPFLWKQGMRFTFGFSLTHPGIRKVGRLMIPGILGTGVANINLYVDSQFTLLKFMPPGSLISLGTADRVMELVLGGYAISVGTAILPMMSRHAAEHDIPAMKRTMAFSLRIVSFITIPATVGLVLMRKPIVQVLFQHGKFDSSSTEITAWALGFYALGLPFFALVKILVNAFYSTQDTATPVKVAFIAMLANVVFNFIFIKPLLNGGPALSTSLAGVLNCTLLYYLFVSRHGDIGWQTVGEALGRILLASVGMGLAVWGMLHFVSFSIHYGFLRRAASLGMVLSVATGLYFLLAWLLHCEELSDIYGIARRRKVESAS